MKINEMFTSNIRRTASGYALRGLFWVLLATLMFGSLSACTPPTDEKRVAMINRRVAPEGHFTNTHFIVSWPALKDKYFEAKPLKLKIPLEYLHYQRYLRKPKENPVLRRDAGVANYVIYRGNIDRIGMRVTYDAKPAQLRPTKHYTDEEWQQTRADKQKMDEILKWNMSHFNISISRDIDGGFHRRALENKKNGVSDGFYVEYFGNTPEHKREFQVYWDLHGHEVVLYGVVAPAEYHPEEYYSGSDLSPFPIDKTNPYYRHTELEDWRDIAIPVRDLLESFVVTETP